MGLYSPKIDRDTANNVKRKILKKEIFHKENCYFSKYGFLHFLLHLGQFLCYTGSFYLYGILKVRSLRINNGFNSFYYRRYEVKYVFGVFLITPYLHIIEESFLRHVVLS